MEKELREFQMISIQLFRDIKERFEGLEDDIRRLENSIKNLSNEVDAFLWEVNGLSENGIGRENTERRG